MHTKNEIDKQAEREAIALLKQGRDFKDKRLRFVGDYNKQIFNKLFKDKE